MTPSHLTASARRLRRDDTWAEKLMWRWLRDRRFSAYKFRRQHPFGPYILDFFCVEAFPDVELDGGQHGHPETRTRDEERDRWLAARGLRVQRFWNSRLRWDKDAIRSAIWDALQEHAPQPVPGYCWPLSHGSETALARQEKP